MGQSFAFWDPSVEKINKKGSDFFNFIMIAAANTFSLISACYYLIHGTEKYINLLRHEPINLFFLLIIVEPLVVFINFFLFIWFMKLTKN